jgi:biopolymer transport protein ExbB
VTTVLGLVTAIVLILFHSGLVSKSRGLIVFLEEQSAGIMALRSENQKSG